MDTVGEKTQQLASIMYNIVKCEYFDECQGCAADGSGMCLPE